MKSIFGDNGVFRIGGGVFFGRFGSYLVTQQVGLMHYRIDLPLDIANGSRWSTDLALG